MLIEITWKEACIFLGLALFTTILVRFLISDKRDKWFRRSQPKSPLMVKGALGDFLALGYPVTWQGFLVTLGLLAVIILECLLIIWFFSEPLPPK